MAAFLRRWALLHWRGGLGSLEVTRLIRVMVAARGAQELLPVPVTATSFVFLVRGVQILVNWDDVVASCLHALAPDIPLVDLDC